MIQYAQKKLMAFYRISTKNDFSAGATVFWRRADTTRECINMLP
jgi:hypothetical protein